MKESLVFMGVAGCGKSTLAAAIAHGEGVELIEGDAHHCDANLQKMRSGIALTDADRSGWLDVLAEQLRAKSQGIVLTCSALRLAYRDRLRVAAPGLRFVFMDISRDDALVRVVARAATHFFSASLVDSQIATLEPPIGEPGVLRVDATAPLPRLQAEVTAWIHQSDSGRQA